MRITRDARTGMLISVALAVLTLLVFSRSFRYPFVNYDDSAYVFLNPHVGAGLTLDSVRWAFTTFDCGNWHPLTWLSLQLDCQLYGGLKPGGFHLTNVLLHTANALLLFFVLVRMTGELWRGAVVAALFALHPLHVESVAWVSERKDVLSTLFWMLTLTAYLHYVRRPGVGRYLLVLLALGLGLLAKPMLVTLPCVLLLLDYWPLRRRGLRNLIIEKIPMFALVLASCVVTFFAQLEGKAVAPFETFPLAARFGNAVLVYVGYLGKMFWPMHLAVFYPHPGPTMSVAGALGAGLLVAVLTVLVLGPGRRWPYLAVGWLWYVGTLVPVIGLVQVGDQGMADRYTYVPLIGLFLLLTWGAADLATAWRLPRRYLATAASVVLSACAVLSWIQVGHWRSTLDLWEHTAAVTENNALAHLSLGFCYHERGRILDAKREYEKTAALAPKVASPHLSLGNILAELGRPEQAVGEYRQAIALAPVDAGPHNNLGNLLAQMGRFDEAKAEFHTASALAPADAGPHNNLGRILHQEGQLGEAEAEYRQAIALAPVDAGPHNNLGNLLAQTGRFDEAKAEFHTAIALAPADAGPHNNLGRVFQEEGRLEEAAAEYRTALELGDKQALSRLQACERMRLLRARLPGLIAGRDQPRDNAERLAFADLCRQPGERRYALAARLYTDAFRADPSLADDPRTANRFHAASAAAAAGCGQGEDAAMLDENEKAGLRRQALNWLRDELAFWSPHARSDRPPVRKAVEQALRGWRQDAGLAGVRDSAALAKRTEVEREAWRKLWQEVEAVLAQAGAPKNNP